MHKFVRNLLTAWRGLKLPFEDEIVIIAVSGGADSTALAVALADLAKAKKIRLNFIVAHFNHKLRGADSDADEEFVSNLADKLEFKFISAIQNPKSKIQNQKGNLEQNARRARYEFLSQTAQKENAFAVLTAHTVNDQAETFLLNLIRGSGTKGLSAMHAIRNLNDDFAIPNPQSAIRLLRPLLNWAKREDTENFAREKNIDFRKDLMNADEKFSRVKIRQKLIPLLKEFNPKIVETLAQTAFLLQSEYDSLLPVEKNQPENLAVKNLQNLSQPKLYNELRNWLKARRGNLLGISLKNIDAIERLIFSPKSGRKIELPGGSFVIKKGGKIFFEKSEVEKTRSGN